MKILVTDDEAPARSRLSSLLAELEIKGLEVAEATNGAEALKAQQEKGFDVVLMDIKMPVMDGLEAANLLMRMEQPPALIFTTAYDQYAL